MALLAGALFLLLAATMAAAGEVALGILFAGTAALWMWIAAVEAQDASARAATRKVPGQIRRQAMPSRT